MINSLIQTPLSVEQDRARKNLFCDAGEKQTASRNHHSKNSSESRHADRSRHHQSKRSKSHSRSTSRPSKHSLKTSPGLLLGLETVN